MHSHNASGDIWPTPELAFASLQKLRLIPEHAAFVVIRCYAHSSPVPHRPYSELSISYFGVPDIVKELHLIAFEHAKHDKRMAWVSLWARAPRPVNWAQRSYWGMESY